MSRIPKSAQRLITMYNAQREARLRAASLLPAPGTTAAPRAPGAPPRRLVAGTPGNGLYEVFFNGTRQHLCTVADVDQGFITRYTHGRGNTPLTMETETLHGLVEIRRKGQKHVKG